MARDVCVRVRTISYYYFIIVIIGVCGANTIQQTEFNSVTVLRVEQNEDYKKIEFEVQGRNIVDGMQIKITKTEAVKGSVCKEDVKNYTVKEVKIRENSADYILLVPHNLAGNIYFCLSQIKTNNELTAEERTWLHQGENVTLKFGNDANSRQLRDSNGPPALHEIKIVGLRIDAGDRSPEFADNGVPDLLVGVEYTFRLFGTGFTERTVVAFTKYKADYLMVCSVTASDPFPVVKESLQPHTVQVKIKLPILPADATAFYFCVKDGNASDASQPFIHQGTDPWISVTTHDMPVPIWAAIIIIVICLCFSALFSGLNLGLMSIDKTELKILSNTGTPKERMYAKRITPVRNHGNYLLCSILLGNVLVNSTFTILLDGLTSSGVVAVVFSTLAIVIFGEITPQAVCSRHGLAVGARTIHITKFLMGITAPLAYPISKLLDWILGEEIGNVYTRERLKELVKVTTGENDLDKDEVNIISGALELRKKNVSAVMTRIDDVFMLDYEAVLDFETVSEIMKSGFSRIPVFEGTRKNIVTMLYIKDLAFVDPDDNTPLKTLCQFYQNPCNFVFEDVTLDVMFKQFKEGNKGHMAFVHRVNSEGEGDPFYETIGLITLEDVIEELIQAEIMDETDVFTDNRTKRRRNADRTKPDFSVFAERRGDNNRIRISPQLTLATYQYLSTSVDPFKLDTISETILRRLLKQDIVIHVKKNKDWRNDTATVIYQQAKAVDFFVLILEGRVEVTVGRENLMFESGPFTFFGIQALTQNIGIDSPVTAPTTLGSLQSLNMDAMLRHTFQPDYTVRACTEVLYMKVKRSLYMAAKRATLMERSQKDTNISGEQFDDEVEKLLHSLEDDEGSVERFIPGRHTPKSSVTFHNENGCSPKGTTPNNISPTAMHNFNAVDPNSAIKYDHEEDAIKKEEEVSLLSKNL